MQHVHIVRCVTCSLGAGLHCDWCWRVCVCVSVLLFEMGVLQGGCETGVWQHGVKACQVTPPKTHRWACLHIKTHLSSCICGFQQTVWQLCHCFTSYASQPRRIKRRILMRQHDPTDAVGRCWWWKALSKWPITLSAVVCVSGAKSNDTKRTKKTLCGGNSLTLIRWVKKHRKTKLFRGFYTDHNTMAAACKMCSQVWNITC